MLNNRKLFGAGVAAAVGVVAVGLTFGSAYSQMKPCCDEENIKYSQDLWSVLAKAKLVGTGAKADTPYKGQAPHGAVLETIHSEATVGGHKGMVVVKRNYGGEGVSIDAVKKDAAKYLKAVTVMFKRKAGYDPDNANWFWAKYNADGSLAKNPKGMQLAGRVMKGADKGCIACHSAVKDKDYLFGKQN